MAKMGSGDTAFVLLACALVMLMTLGLALFYGGLVRSKNVLATMMQSFMCLGVVSILWVVCGYSLAFGPDHWGLIGGLDWALLGSVGLDPGPYAATIPHLLFSAFQLMFAIITPPLITGAFAERMKFSGFLLFTVLWTLLVYLPVCHWLWGGGWLGKLDALDFAGGNVVHINSGAAALASALLVGKRRGYHKEPFQPHNLSLTVLGARLLWFGWFGFNAGSALAAGTVAVLAFFNTQVATGSTLAAWITVEWMKIGKPTTLGAASGANAGMVAVPPAAGFVSPMPAVWIGLVVGGVFYGAVLVKEKLNYDDALDVVGIHGVGGLRGALAAGLFAFTAYNAAGADGLFYGNATQLLVQAVGALGASIYSFALSWVLLKVTGIVTGLRVPDKEEVQGLDVSQHSETSYKL